MDATQIPTTAAGRRRAARRRPAPAPNSEPAESTQIASIPGGPPIALEPRWANLGVVKGWDPTPVQRVCMWVSGDPGVGKTCFVNTNPRALVLDCEDKSRDVIHATAHRVTIKDYAAFKSVFDALLEDAESAKPSFEHVAIDSIDQFRLYVVQFLTDEYNKHRSSGRGKIGNLIRDTHGQSAYDAIQEHIVTGVLLKLFAAGYGWTVVGRLREKEITEIGSDGKERKVIKTQAAISSSLLVPIYGATDIMTHIVRSYDSHEVKVPGEFADRGKKIPLVRYEKISRVSLQLEPADTVHTRGAAGKIKARYLEYLPGQLDIPLRNPWSAYADAYAAALQSAQDELNAEASSS